MSDKQENSTEPTPADDVEANKEEGSRVKPVPEIKIDTGKADENQTMQIANDGGKIKKSQSQTQAKTVTDTKELKRFGKERQSKPEVENGALFDKKQFMEVMQPDASNGDNLNYLVMANKPVIIPGDFWDLGLLFYLIWFIACLWSAISIIFFTAFVDYECIKSRSLFSNVFYPSVIIDILSTAFLS